jgi:hypothetical protein
MTAALKKKGAGAHMSRSIPPTRKARMEPTPPIRFITPLA